MIDIFTESFWIGYKDPYRELKDIPGVVSFARNWENGRIVAASIWCETCKAMLLPTTSNSWRRVWKPVCVCVQRRFCIYQWYRRSNLLVILRKLQWDTKTETVLVKTKLSDEETVIELEVPHHGYSIFSHRLFRWIRSNLSNAGLHDFFTCCRSDPATQWVSGIYFSLAKNEIQVDSIRA